MPMDQYERAAMQANGFLPPHNNNAVADKDRYLIVRESDEGKRIVEGHPTQQDAAPHQPYELGQDYLIRTVTHIDIGTVVEVGPQEIVLENASWIADTGRYHNAVKDGTLNEVEPYSDGERVILGRGAVIDACRWNHSLPRTQK